MQSGFQVLARKRAVSQEWVQKFATIPVANISDSMSRLNAGGAPLRPLHAGGVLCGPAVTVKTRPGDNLMVHMALCVASKGDVIVVDAGGDLTNAIVGERMLAYAVAKEFAGVIIYGAVRDLAWIREQRFPVYACGVTHQGPYKDGPGEINTTIALGSMSVEPGDLIIGDDDGVMCVPYDAVADIQAKAQAKFEHESNTFAAIGKGNNNAEAYRAKLEKLGCYFDPSIKV